MWGRAASWAMTGVMEGRRIERHYVSTRRLRMRIAQRIGCSVSVLLIPLTLARVRVPPGAVRGRVQRDVVRRVGVCACGGGCGAAPRADHPERLLAASAGALRDRSGGDVQVRAPAQPWCECLVAHTASL